MPARSFAIDAWASRLLFLGVANGQLRLFLEGHRCSPRGHTFFTRWQIGPEYMNLSFVCSNCNRYDGMMVRTPFNLFSDPISEYMIDGWPELTWDSVIASWQLRHRAHVEPDDAQFMLGRSFGNGRIAFTLTCPCGNLSPPSAGWPLEGTTRGLSYSVHAERPTSFHQDQVQDTPKVLKSKVVNPERLVRHRASGRVYRLPAFTIHLEPVEGEAQPLSCQVENLSFEFDRFYDGVDDRRFQTWHERLVKE